jgi:penicillin-binding protein 1C
VEDGALVVLDNVSGEVLAWVGSSGSLSDASQVDGVIAPRQPGSTLKPFLYALAIEQRILTAASILDDSPVAVTTAGGLYVPQNYDHVFRGRVSLRTALAGSLNVPAVRTLALLGYEPFYERLRALGFASLTRDADHYGYSLALGAGDVTLLALTNAYRTLSNQGRSSPVRVLPDDALPRMEQTLDPAAAYIVSDILADSAARATTFGMASALTTRYPSSVKTGTSTDMRDNWAIGFSTHYTVGVWVGNFSGEPMHDVSGVSGAAPIWRDVMDSLHEGRIPAPPAVPAGLVQQTVRYANAEEPERQEWFLVGTETQVVVAIEAPAGRPRIVSPAKDAILAIDPDIPRGRQRVLVSTTGVPSDAYLLVDDERRAVAHEPYLWSPTPGRHVLRLVDAKGRELDRAQVTVRGLRLGRRAQ